MTETELDEFAIPDYPRWKCDQPRDKKGKFVKKENIEFDENWVQSVLNVPYEYNDVGPSVDMSFKDDEVINTDVLGMDIAIDPVEIKGINFDGYGIVYGGPYDMKPAGMKGIKLAPEVPGKYDHLMCIDDFGVPSSKEMDLAILMGLQYLQEDGSFYVGCMMGQGRTGTFLACMLKVFGCIDTVNLVRSIYNENAVETISQGKFVHDYDVEKFAYLVRFLPKK